MNDLPIVAISVKVKSVENWLHYIQSAAKQELSLLNEHMAQSHYDQMQVKMNEARTCPPKQVWANNTELVWSISCLALLR